MRAIQLFIDSKGGASVATVFGRKQASSISSLLAQQLTDLGSCYRYNAVHRFTTNDGSFIEVQYTREESNASH